MARESRIAVLRPALLPLVLLTALTVRLAAADEGRPEGSVVPTASAGVCPAGAVDLTITGETFGMGESTDCLATGSITVGPTVTFGDGSDTLLLAPVTTLVSEIGVEMGAVLTISHFMTGPLPKTGQSACHDTAGDPVEPCTDTGQDGEVQAGESWPSPRFTVNGDGTVTDNMTGLVWMKDPECGALFDFPDTSWTAAVAAANGMAAGQCGLTDGSTAGDWRLPSAREFLSLFHWGFVGAALPDTAGTGQWSAESPFTGLHVLDGPPSNYWTSTAFSDRTNLVWCTDLFSAKAYICLKDSTEYVWMVRGQASGDEVAPVPDTGQGNSLAAGDDGDQRPGVAWPQPRFIDLQDGTVVDLMTGLVWLKDAGCSGHFTNWAGALSAAASLEDGDCGLSDGSAAGDWQLPNILQLLSLVHYGYDAMALPDAEGTGQWSAGAPFTDVEAGSYWSSTTYTGETDKAWALPFNTGEAARYDKTTSLYVWPVRGAL